ncbi:hypothetical protein CEXT_554701 [Caerostris extrusa]|uniref:Uncharacterized protein n=1 Tax=Caerostris extrusa TaxID=172846 RepID=A0AAV4PVU1_CAEEX|nr:hypothetical protein CEXT_554701 [Caerostris extrusa]
MMHHVPYLLGDNIASVLSKTLTLMSSAYNERCYRSNDTCCYKKELINGNSPPKKSSEHSRKYFRILSGEITEILLYIKSDIRYVDKSIEQPRQSLFDIL